MPKGLILAPHPRLYVGRREMDRLKDIRLPLLKAASREVASTAEEFAKSPVFDYPVTRHNAHLIRARTMQKRIVTLLVRWLQTGRERFRAAAVEHVREMARWRYWSWITWRKRDARPKAIFDLSYGENSATLAVAYDWLHGTLSAPERRLFVETARKRSLEPFLANTRRGRESWWFGDPESNWNTVCAGGAGMLALAMREEIPESGEVLARVERSIAPYMRYLAKSSGAWPEGVGYWNYGMRYAFMYLLSRERATGRAHPLMEQPATAATLRFPLDFTPNGVPCGFGDSNHWSPLPFHYAAAERLGSRDILAELDARSGNIDRGAGAWPTAAEFLLLHPGKPCGRPRPERRIVRLYRGLNFGVMADRMPAPRMYLSARGGEFLSHHGHLDLLSFHCVVGRESMITNLGVDEYLDTTFSLRRFDIFEMRPDSKNTILINGVGTAVGSSTKTGLLTLPGAAGFRIDATGAFGAMRDGPVTEFCGRAFLMLGEEAFLVIDRVELPHPGRMESRMHTFCDVRLAKRGLSRSRAALRGESEKMSVAYAADVPASLWTATGAPTTPSEGATMLRWCTDALHEAMTMATLLVPGGAPAAVEISSRGAKITVAATVRGRSRRIVLDTKLRPAR